VDLDKITKDLPIGPISRLATVYGASYIYTTLFIHSTGSKKTTIIIIINVTSPN